MDVLAEVIADLRLESSVYCRFEATAPWAVAYPEGQVAAFHVVSEGSCELEIEGREEVLRLEAGDLVVLPHGRAHVLRAGRGARAASVSALAERADEGRVRYGGGGALTRYLCGAFRFGAQWDHPLLSALPEAIHVPRGSGDMLPWLRTHLDAVACEASSGRPGAGVVIARLSDVLFVQAVRAYLANLPPEATGWAGALRDPQIARVLGLIHRYPGRRWTVAALAREAAMSRSHFAARFAERVGEPPMVYLSAWRMHRARAMLRDHSSRLEGISRTLGYGSAAAFATAFKRSAGITPGQYRREALGAAG